MAIKYCYTGLIDPRSKDNDEVGFYYSLYPTLPESLISGVATAVTFRKITPWLPFGRPASKSQRFWFGEFIRRQLIQTTSVVAGTWLIETIALIALAVSSTSMLVS